MKSNSAKPDGPQIITTAAKWLGVGAVMVGLAGCPSTGLPDRTAFTGTELVTVANGLMVETSLGAGAASLSDSTWAVLKSDGDTLLFRIVFGPDGEVERLFDSVVFAKEWLGTEIIPDTQVHTTDFPGGSYVSGAYGAEHGEDVGVLGVLHGMMLGAHLGTATLSLSGRVVGDRIDGTMVRTVTIFADTPFAAPSNAEFQAYALRER